MPKSAIAGFGILFGAASIADPRVRPGARAVRARRRTLGARPKVERSAVPRHQPRDDGIAARRDRHILATSTKPENDGPRAGPFSSPLVMGGMGAIPQAMLTCATTMRPSWSAVRRVASAVSL